MKVAKNSLLTFFVFNGLVEHQKSQNSVKIFWCSQSQNNSIKLLLSHHKVSIVHRMIFAYQHSVV